MFSSAHAYKPLPRRAHTQRTYAGDVVKLNHDPSKQYVLVGDIHGCLDQFQELFQKLPDNAVICLVGDLIDRGPNSVDLIRYIQQLNETTPGKVIAVRGNHEENVLALFRVLRKYNSELTQADWDYYRAFYTDLIINGAEWILTDTVVSQEISQLRLASLSDSTIPFGEQVKGILKRKFLDFDNVFRRFKDNTVIIPEWRMMYRFLNSLPYVVCVGDPGVYNPNHFIFAHADLPFSDDELAISLSHGPHYLNDAAKECILNERNHFSQKRTALSTRFYCGHNVTYCYSSAIKPLSAEPVRDELNTINLDSGAYTRGSKLCGYLLAVNHTTSHVFCWPPEIKEDSGLIIYCESSVNRMIVNPDASYFIKAFIEEKKLEKDHLLGQDALLQNRSRAAGTFDKERYLTELSQNSMSRQEKTWLALEILQSKHHPLKKERSWFRWASYSNETRSILKMLMILQPEGLRYDTSQKKLTIAGYQFELSRYAMDYLILEMNVKRIVAEPQFVVSRG